MRKLFALLIAGVLITPLSSQNPSDYKRYTKTPEQQAKFDAYRERIRLRRTNAYRLIRLRKSSPYRIQSYGPPPVPHCGPSRAYMFSGYTDPLPHLPRNGG